MKTITNIAHPAVALFALACFALTPQAQAICQQGCNRNDNTFLGDDALINNEFGFDSTAIGFEALFSMTTSGFNTAVGSQALFSLTASEANTAVGFRALYENTTGGFNTAIGLEALGSNTTAFGNTAIGTGALFGNTTGEDNTASGDDALVSNTTGNFNTATGSQALSNNTIGVGNTATGDVALFNNTAGNYNIAVGFKAGFNLTTGDRNIDIGNGGLADESSTIRIGRRQDQTATFIAGISGIAVAGGVGVMIDSNGQLGTIVSSQRFKEGVKPMDKASEAILALKPVTFRYKHDLDRAGIPQFGLVADDVEKVNPDLVARDEQGKPYTVRYEAVNAMLLNEFLKEHKAFVEEQREVQEQKATIAQLKHNFTEQQKQIEALTAGLQRVSAQLELSKSGAQSIANNQ